MLSINEKKLVKIKYKVDSYQGIASLLLSCKLKGHKFVKLERTDTEAIIYYEKEKKHDLYCEEEL